MRSLVLVTILITVLASCKSPPQKDGGVQSTNASEGGVGNEFEQAAQLKYFAEKRNKGELFRIFVSSDRYQRTQLAHDGKVKLKDDPDTDKELSDDIGKDFDKINYEARALLSIELYPDSGKISRVRFLRPTGLSETDKLVSDDVSRLRFMFEDEDKIYPTNFNIGYLIVLQKKQTRAEAKEMLQKYAK